MFGAATPRADRAVGPGLRRAAGDRAHPGRPRGLRARARLPAARGPGHGSRCTESRPRRRRVTPEKRELIEFEVRARGRCWRRVRRSRSAAAPPPRRDRRVRRRRPRDARRDRAGAVRRVAAPRPAGPAPASRAAPGSAGRAMTIPALEIEHAYRRCEADHPRGGGELLLRDPAAAARQAPGDERRVRVRAPGRRHRRRRPDRAAKLAALESERRLLADLEPAAPRPPRTRWRSRSATRTGTTGCRSTRSSSSSTASRPTCSGRRTRRSTSWSSTAGRSRARSGGCASRSSRRDRARRRRAAALADDLGVAMQLTNILRDVREDRDRGRVYLPAEDLRRFGCEDLFAAPRQDAAALIRFEADARGGVVRPRARARRAARPPQRRVRARDDRHLPRHPRPDRARPDRGPGPADLAAGVGEGVGRRPEPRSPTAERAGDDQRVAA